MSSIPAEITNFFLAMQVGAVAAERMRGLFTDDAVYEEPFSGVAREHSGPDAILETMKLGWLNPLPEMHIEIDQATAAGHQITVDWTCHSPALPGGLGRGTNHFTLRAGRIAKLRTVFR